MKTKIEVGQREKAENDHSKICDWLLSEYSFDFGHETGRFYSCAPMWIAEVVHKYIHTNHQIKQK